jgi:hypothetical protein
MPDGEEGQTMAVLIRTLPRLSRSVPTDRISARPEPLEDALVRRSVDALHAGRVVCGDCHRTPLLGERVYSYGARVVCELCRARHRAAPDSSALVRSPAHGGAVRVVPT